jgi:hypothetical protein
MWWRLDLFGMWDGVPIGYRYGFAILVLGGIVLLIGAALKELEWCRPHGDSRTQTDDKRTENGSPNLISGHLCRSVCQLQSAANIKSQVTCWSHAIAASGTS